MEVCKRYASSADAHQQLHNTFVELDGDLCHIEGNDGWIYTARQVVKEGKHRRWSKVTKNINIKNMDLNLQQFPLGYVNYDKSAYYLQRKPLRKWKQGYYADYLTTVKNLEDKIKPQPLAAHQLRERPKLHPTTRTIAHSSAMIDLYDNNYPSFYRAWVMVRLLEHQSVAWHRHWAFQRKEVKRGRGYSEECWLMYKGKHVGSVKDGKVVINHKFRYLTEPFVEAMIHAS